MTTDGFVKLPRTMLEWGWLDDGNTLKVYIVLLLSANWKDGEWHGIKVKRGQLITSYPKLAEKCSMSVQEIRTVLNRLKSTGDITVQTTSKFSIITVNNYEIPEEATDKSTGNQQASNIQSANDQQSANSQPTTIEERKEEKEIKEKEEAPPSPSFISSDSPITRDDLIGRYGSENVSIYESKLAAWKSKKGITGAFDDYKAIAGWLAQDNVQKSSSFSEDEVWRRILDRYKNNCG